MPSEPDTDTVRSGSYPLSRTLMFVVPRRATDTARAFVDFCAGANGRGLVRSSGYIAMAKDDE